jgi:hypothetical protein
MYPHGGAPCGWSPHSVGRSRSAALAHSRRLTPRSPLFQPHAPGQRGSSRAGHQGRRLLVPGADVKAVVCKGPCQAAVEDVPEPVIKHPGDGCTKVLLHPAAP